MRPTLTSIVCFTLFVLTHSAPAQKRCCEPGPTCFDPCPPQDIEQADLAPGADEFAFAPLSQQGEEGEQDDQDDQSLMMNDCCEPGPTCSNPCQQGPPPQQFAASLPPPPPVAPMLPPPPPPVAPMLPPPPPPVAPMLPPQPPPPIYTGNSNCCQPGPTCNDPCPAPFMAPPIAPPMPAPMPAPMPPPSFQTPMAPPMAPPMGGPIDPCCDPGMVQGCANPCAPPAQPEPPKSYAPYPGEITFKLQQTWDVDKYLNEKTPAFQILAGNLKNAIKDVLGPMTTTSNIYFREGYVPGNPSTMPKVVAHVMVNGGSDDASILQRAVTPDGTLGDGLKALASGISENSLLTTASYGDKNCKPITDIQDDHN